MICNVDEREDRRWVRVALLALAGLYQEASWRWEWEMFWRDLGEGECIILEGGMVR